MGRYEFLENIAVADCALEVQGADVADVFGTAARALADLMVDPATVVPEVERTITLEAPSLDLLLYDWLSELIYLKDTEQQIFPAVEVEVDNGAPCRLTARLRGGRIVHGRTALRADAKAVTFHQFALEPRDGGWRARVVIDI
jgi:SHS2 domain-containing protein